MTFRRELAKNDPVKDFFRDPDGTMDHILFSHVTGNANSREAAVAFVEAEKLMAFHTSLVMPDCFRVAASGRRSFPLQVQKYLNSHPFWESLRLFCRRFPKIQRLVARIHCGTIEQVNRRFDFAVSRAVRRCEGVSMVYAYMDAAEQTFLVAKLRGLKTIYELPTPYWRFTRDRVIEEAKYQPEWAMTLPVLDEDSETMLRRDRELQLADEVIVPSELVRDSLKLAPPFKAKVHIVPYGCPEFPPPISDLRSPVAQPPSPLRVLYVGSLNQGKGLAYLAEAMLGLEERVKLTVIGSRTSSAPCVALDHFLSSHRHRTGLSHEEVLAEMQQHDVLVLPTLYEGLALVLLEAMACGLTVITTEHSGLAGLVVNGREGFIVPIRNVRAIHDCLQLLAGDTGRLLVMQQAALAWSREHTWRRYRELLRDVIAV